MKINFIPFRTGDVVREKAKHIVGYSSEGDIYGGKIGTIHIIHKFSLDTQEYSTNRGAWYPHECFELVEESNLTSLNELLKQLEDEYE